MAGSRNWFIRAFRKWLFWLSGGQAPHPDALDEVRARLSGRPELVFEDWVGLLSPLPANSTEVARFLYEKLPLFFGIEAGRTRPHDRLKEELMLDRIGWSDWDFDYLEEFKARFGVDAFPDDPQPNYSDIAGWIMYMHMIVHKAPNSRTQ
jgi:hypothetical protein